MTMLSPAAEKVARRLDEEAKSKDDAWQIPAAEAAAIHQIVLATGCRSVLEIGVSYGFSTLHLAHAVRLNKGTMHAIDASEKKISAARANLNEAGVIDIVSLHLGRAQDVLRSLVPRMPFDCLFIDAVKDECFDYLSAAWPRLAENCIILTDNTSTHPEELKPFLEHLRSHREVIASHTIDIGNGFELSIRRTGRPQKREPLHQAWSMG